MVTWLLAISCKVRVVRAKGNKKDLGTRLKPPGFRYASFLISLSPLSSAILFSGGWFHYNRAALWPQNQLYRSENGLSSDLAAI
jgi:hypothetical protein